MATYLISNSVFSDGMGDFYHLTDILKALFSNEKYSDISFIIIVSSYHDDQRVNDRIQHELAALCKGKSNVTTHFHYARTPVLIPEALFYGKKIDQVIHVSCSDVLVSLYDHALDRKCPVKVILEHECVSNGKFGRRAPSYSLRGERTFDYYSMGLGTQCLGIKMKPKSEMTDQDAWDVLSKKDSGFFSKVCELTQSETPADLIEHAVIPAYFNKPDDFCLFFIPRVFR